MTSKNQNRNIAIIIGLVILVLFISNTQTLSFENTCGASWWDINYDKINEVVTIPINTQINTVNCLSGSNVNVNGVSAFTTQEDCEKWGLSWRDSLVGIPTPSYNCHVSSENWINDKEINNIVDCTFTCTHPNGCAGITGTTVEPRTLGFNGERINLPSPSLAGGDNDWSSSCNGEITITMEEIIPPECVELEETCGTRTELDSNGKAVWECNPGTLQFEFQGFEVGKCGVECNEGVSCSSGSCVDFECTEDGTTNTIILVAIFIAIIGGGIFIFFKFR